MRAQATRHKGRAVRASYQPPAAATREMQVAFVAACTVVAEYVNVRGERRERDPAAPFRPQPRQVLAEGSAGDGLELLVRTLE